MNGPRNGGSRARGPGSQSFGSPTRSTNATPDRGHAAASTVAGAGLDALPSRIRDRIAVDPASGCWIWQGSLDRYGYGRIGGRGAHRVIWELLKGPVPDGLVLDHREDWGCISKACCFPGHLKPVTPAANSLRGGGCGAVNAVKVRCDNGHEFDLLNTYWRPDGHRDCRACIRARVRRYQRRKRYASREAFRQAA